MVSYIIRRIAQSLVVVVIVTIVVFFAVRLALGNPIYLYVPEQIADNMTLQQLAQLRHELGLDRPLPVQYLDWLGGVVRGDLGQALLKRGAVGDLIAQRAPVTFYLGALAFLVSLIGIPLGAVSAVRRAKWSDTIVTVLANIGITVPTFWLGILLMYAIGLKLRLLPLYGYTSPFVDFSLSTRQIIMPVICLAVFGVGSAARQSRSAMLEVIRQDYIRTAWSKGLRERVVVLRHALKNSLLPVITLKGMTISNLLGGSVLVETVFNIPGMGRLATEAVFIQDYMILQGVILVIAGVVALGNLLVDVAQGWLDPRIRYE